MDTPPPILLSRRANTHATILLQGYRLGESLAITRPQASPFTTFSYIIEERSKGAPHSYAPTPLVYLPNGTPVAGDTVT